MRSLSVLLMLALFVATIYSAAVPLGLRPAREHADGTASVLPTAEPTSSEPTPTTTVATVEKAENEASTVAGVVILKRKKGGKGQKAEFKQLPITAPPKEPVVRKSLKLPTSKNYGLQTGVQTHLVDSNGKILRNVSAIPIRVASKKPSTPKPSATISQVESEAAAPVAVHFGAAPISLL
ncbi:unnamed protein product, partial [Mesorhabditis spiculigera]